MREIQKMCRICLNKGSKDIFEQSLGNSLSRGSDELSRIAEKLRFVTMLKVNPKENLPQQICDLCIVQLNVSYNFKRLALKNDFQIRQYMIENGMSLMREDDDIETTTTEIHQIQHNVIRTNRCRQLAVPEIRQNSTTSSVSGASTMLVVGNGNDNEANNTPNSLIHPRPMIRPIQIKEEPLDDDEQPKELTPITSSPSNASEPSVITVSSNISIAKRSTPMVQINGILMTSDEKEKSFNHSSKAAPLSVKLSRSRKENTESQKKEETRKLRSIKKNIEVRKTSRKIQKVLKEATKGASARRNEMKSTVKFKKVDRSEAPRKRGRPRKNPDAPKSTYKPRQKAKKS